MTVHVNVNFNYLPLSFAFVCVFQVISAVQRHNQTQVQWSILLEQAIHLEDVVKSQSSSVRLFIHSFPSAHHHGWIRRFIYSPTVGEFSQHQNLKLQKYI